MVNTLKPGMNSSDVRRQIQSVDVSEGDPNIRIQLPGFEQCLLFNDVAVVDDDQFRAEIATRFKKPAICRSPAKVAQTKRRIKGGNVSVAEVKHLMPVANESVIQLSIREDANLAVSTYLKIASKKNSHD